MGPDGIYNVFTESGSGKCMDRGTKKYDVSGLGIQGTCDLMLIAVNPKKVKAMELLFDGGILYSYHYYIATLTYRPVAPM